MEVLLHSGRQMSAWRTAQIHQLITRTYNLKPYTLTQLRYDLRKLKAHGLLERQGRRYLYRLTDKGLKVALMLSFSTSVSVARWSTAFLTESQTQHSL